MAEELNQFDHSGLVVNQATIVILLVVAFVGNSPWPAALTALAMLLGTAFGKPGFGFIYFNVLKPLGWIKPDVYADNQEPHRFAQGFGGVVLAISLLAFFSGSPVTGWILTWVVIALASLNLSIGFCAGCAVYYWLNQLNVPGFVRSAPDGRFPGLRPKF